MTVYEVYGSNEDGGSDDGDDGNDEAATSTTYLWFEYINIFKMCDPLLLINLDSML